MKLRCLALCDPETEPVLRKGASLVEEGGRSGKAQVEFFRRPDQLLYRMRDEGCDVVLIAMGGALGMEAAFSVRAADGGVPLVWISDDGVFAIQSYRLQARRFLTFPVTAEQVGEALRQCS